jgi:hypothetical protein
MSGICAFSLIVLVLVAIGKSAPLHFSQLRGKKNSVTDSVTGFDNTEIGPLPRIWNFQIPSFFFFTGQNPLEVSEERTQREISNYQRLSQIEFVVYVLLTLLSGSKGREFPAADEGAGGEVSFHGQFSCRLRNAEFVFGKWKHVGAECITSAHSGGHPTSSLHAALATRGDKE